MMTLREFSNGLRILWNIEQDEFVKAGCPAEDWRRFADNPHRYFVGCPDAYQDGLWRIIEGRQPRQMPFSSGLLIRRIERDSDEGRAGDVEVVDPTNGATTGSLTWGEVIEQIASRFPGPSKGYPMNTPEEWAALRDASAAKREAREFAEAHDEAIEQERKGG